MGLSLSMSGVLSDYRWYGMVVRPGSLPAAGYLAVAPDLFTAGGALRCLRSTFRAMLQGQGAAALDTYRSRG